MSTTRREFLSGILHGALVPVAVGLAASACGDGGSGTPDDLGSMTCSELTTRIVANHGHTLEVPLADVLEGTDKMYTLADNGTHEHTLTVTAAQFAMLASGTMVTASSTQSGTHAHPVELTCVTLT